MLVRVKSIAGVCRKFLFSLYEKPCLARSSNNCLVITTMTFRIQFNVGAYLKKRLRAKYFQLKKYTVNIFYIKHNKVHTYMISFGRLHPKHEPAPSSLPRCVLSSLLALCYLCCTSLSQMLNLLTVDGHPLTPF